MRTQGSATSRATKQTSHHITSHHPQHMCAQLTFGPLQKKLCIILSLVTQGTLVTCCHPLWLVCLKPSESSPPILNILEDCVCSEQSRRTPLLQSLIHVLVGPKGGWSPRELGIFALMEDQEGTQSVSLGPFLLCLMEKEGTDHENCHCQ